MLENIITLALLILLQAVLGFDNLLYISLESKRAPKEKQKSVRTIGIGIAIGLRIALLFLLINVIKYFQDPVFNIPWTDVIEGSFNIHSLIVLGGGAFIIYTAIKEIWHMMSIEEEAHEKAKPASINKIITMIVIMNIVFSFDSILSAMALTDVFWVMATAIVVSGILMIWLSGTVSTFLQKNKMYEVLGLFVLFVVGIMLLTEGAELAHIKLFEEPIEKMSKTTFYFVISILVIVDIVQGRYKKKLMNLEQKKNNS
ncbi:MAG: tellurium resistance protein TerC [Flavobacteriales bacterium]|nr:tellurium resistance protein TerC [Flavobacteriales bacterium]